MTTAGSGAVFFLGSRAHYQVLNQPEVRYDVENGNTSTETIYQNPSVQELWPKDQVKTEMDGNYSEGRPTWSYCDNEVIEDKEKLEPSSLKRRQKNGSNETSLYDKEADMKPAALNSVGESTTPKTKTRRGRSLLACLSSLARRKRRLQSDQVQYLQHIESVLTRCTYRESCRCFECQSRYFECDESDNSSDDSDYCSRYVPNVVEEYEVPQDTDDEVFVDTVPEDNTSTDLLIEKKEKMSVSSEELEEEKKNLQLEVAAGTPVLLNYLLTHPITCVIQ